MEYLGYLHVKVGNVNDKNAFTCADAQHVNGNEIYVWNPILCDGGLRLVHCAAAVANWYCASLIAITLLIFLFSLHFNGASIEPPEKSGCWRISKLNWYSRNCC